MNSKIKLGIVGCGRAAEQIYLPALKTFGNIIITGVVDPIKERSEIISNKFAGCNRFSSINSEFISQIDSAIICTPPDSHIALAAELLKKSKYVLVEKPLALSLEGISKLAEIESNSQAQLMMAFNHRYWEPAIKLKETLKNEPRINSVEVIFTGNYKMWDPVSFKSDPINDLGPHVFDLIKFIFSNDLLSISAKSYKGDSVDLNIKMIGDFSVKCLIAHSSRTEKTIRIVSENGIHFILINSERLAPEPGFTRKSLDNLDKIKRKITGKVSPIKKSYLLQLKNFFALIESKTSEAPGINEGISAIKAVEAVFASLKKNGKEVFLNEIQ